MMSFLGSHAYEMARKARSLVNSGCCHERPRLCLRMIRPGQIRAARGLLDWTQAQLARAAGLSQVAVKNLERGRTDPRARTPSIVLASFFSTRETPATAGPAYGSNNRTQLIGTQGEIAGASPARPLLEPNW